MAAIESTHTPTGFATVANRISALVALPVQALVDWNNTRVTRNVLVGLTDRELEDIGLMRGDIEMVAKSR